MRKFILFGLALSIPLWVHAADFQNVEIIRCYDGDTCTANLPEVHPFFGQKISVRINGIDTPEIRGKCEMEKVKAKEARDFLLDLIKEASQIDLVSCEKDKYFRIGCTMLLDGENVGDIMIEEGHARQYDGEERESWCPVSTMEES